MDFVSPWMDKIRTTCQRAEIDHIDVIIAISVLLISLSCQHLLLSVTL